MNDKQPKKYQIRPNVVIGLGVFATIILGLTVASIVNPENLPGTDLKDVAVTALAVLAALFQNLINGEEGKDNSMSDIAQLLAKNGNGNGHHPPTPPKQETKPPTGFVTPAGEVTEDIKEAVTIPEIDHEEHDRFFTAFFRTLKHEGEWLLSKEPDGTRVYSGINEKANPNWEGWELLPQAPNTGCQEINTRELRDLTKQRYRENYWNHKMVQAFKDFPNLQQQVFDCHVHGGAGWRLQEACLKLNVQCDKDGLWGPGTSLACKKAVEEHGEIKFNNALVECRHEYIGRAVRKKLFSNNIAKGLRARAISFTLA